MILKKRRTIMTITNPDTGRPLKHYAQDEITKDRYIIIALQNETNPDDCSVVKYDALDANMRAELLSAVNSDEFQKVPEIWKLLDKKYFYDYPKQTMLAVLRGLKQIKVVPQSQVRIELPGDTTMTPKEIVNAIKQYEAEKGKVLTKYRDAEPATSNTTTPQMADIEKRVDNLESKFDTLNNSITDLINAIKQQAKGE